MKTDQWIQIDVDAILNNLSGIRSLLSPQVRLIAVIKANAYGHGLVETARILSHAGVDHFAVTFLSEALQLREAGIPGSILLLSPLSSQDQVGHAIDSHITMMVASIPDGQLVDQTARVKQVRATIHLKIETGLGRFGFTLADALEICGSLKENPFIYIEGIYTHLADAGASDASPSYKQFQLFQGVVASLHEAGYVIPIKHCANSAAFIRFPEMHLDAVRVGTLLSGQYPVGSMEHPIMLKDPFQYKARVIALADLPAGSTLGYYRTFRLRRPAQIAVLPVGFAGGLGLDVTNPPAGWFDALKRIIKLILASLGFSKYGIFVTIKGKRCPVRGKVFMQLALIEVPPEFDIRLGDIADIPVRKTLASPDIKRVYVNNPASEREPSPN